MRSLLRSSSHIALLTSMLLACGDSAGAPGGPTEPPAPDSSADIVAAGSLAFGTCAGPGCEYTIDYRNDGPGCANNVRGTVRLYGNETLLEADDWFLDPAIVLAPGDVLQVEDCCFSPGSVGLQTRFTSEQFWNNVACD